MAYTTTTRLGLKKAVPGTNQPFETSVFNENYDKIDAEAVAADTRLDLIEAKNGDQDSLIAGFAADVAALEAADVALDARIDTLEATDIAYDTRLDSIEALNVTQNTRLDGMDTLNTTQNNRITATETKNATQDQRLAVLEIATGNPPVDFVVDGGTP